MNATTTTPAPLHPVIRHADGRRTRRGELSFITTELNRLGNFKSQDCFDVPAESYVEGWVTGYRCAAELLDALARDVEVNVRQVVKDAVQASADPRDKNGRRGASAGFMEIMAEAVKFMGRNAHHGRWMADKIETAERQRIHWAQIEAEQNAAFRVRMKAQREAKRAALPTVGEVPS